MRTLYFGFLVLLFLVPAALAERTILIDTRGNLTESPTVRVNGQPFAFPSSDAVPVDTLHSIRRLGDGTVELSIKGDLVLNSDDTLRGIGNYPVVIRVGNDAYIPTGAKIDFSAISMIPGAGGGKGTAGGEGGSGGEKGSGGRGGSAGSFGSGGASFIPSLSPVAITTPGIPAGDGSEGRPGQQGGNGSAGAPGQKGHPGFAAPLSAAGAAGAKGARFLSSTNGGDGGPDGQAAAYPPRIWFQSDYLRDFLYQRGTGESSFRRAFYDGADGEDGFPGLDWTAPAPGSIHEGKDAAPGTNPSPVWTLAGGSSGGSGGGGAGGAGGMGGGGGGGGAGGHGEWIEPINTSFVTSDLLTNIGEVAAVGGDKAFKLVIGKVVNSYLKNGEFDLNLTPIFDYGATGAKGGKGGQGGFGSDGGAGGDGGNGGAGGGALLISAQGRIMLEGTILANGADGEGGESGALAPSVFSGPLLGQQGGSRLRGFGMSTFLSPASAFEDILSPPRAGLGGKGGDGGHGGRGLDGFPGGDGAGGSAGSIILSASSILNPSGTGAFEVEGGEGPEPQLKGDDGRVFLGSNTIAPGSDTGTILASGNFSLTGSIAPAPTAAGPLAPNPFIAGNPLTPTISELRDGAEGFGFITELSDALQVGGVDLRSNVPSGGDEPVICAMRFDVGPPPYDEDYEGHDLILVFNFLNQPLTDVRFGANPQPLVGGAPDPANPVSFNSIPLTEGGHTKDPSFGGSGDVASAAMAPFEVFALLIPEDTATTGHNFAITATLSDPAGDVTFRFEEEHFENGEIICATGNADVPVYTAEWAPAVGTDGNWNDADNWSVISPPDAPVRNDIIPNNVIEVAAYNVGINLADADVTQDTSITIDRLRIGPTNTLTIQNDYQLLLKKFDVRANGGLVENQGVILLDSSDLTAPPTSLKFQGQSLVLSGPGLLTTSLNPNNLIGSDLVVDSFIQETDHTILASGMLGNGNLNFTNCGLVQSHSGVALLDRQTLVVDPSHGSSHHSATFKNSGNLLVGNQYSELILTDGHFENLPGGTIGFAFDSGSPPPAGNTQLLRFDDVRLRGGLETIAAEQPGQIISLTGTNLIEDIVISAENDSVIHLDNTDLTLSNATLLFDDISIFDNFTAAGPALAFTHPGIIENSTIRGGTLSLVDHGGLFTCENPSTLAIDSPISFRPLLTGTRVTLNNTTIDGSYCYDRVLEQHRALSTAYFESNFPAGLPTSNAYLTLEVFAPELDLDGTITNNGVFDFKNAGNSNSDHTDVLIGSQTIIGGTGSFTGLSGNKNYTFRARDAGPSLLTIEDGQFLFRPTIDSANLELVNHGHFFDVTWDYDANPAGAPSDPGALLTFLQSPTLGINNNYLEPGGVFGGGVLDNRNGTLGISSTPSSLQNLVVDGGNVVLDPFLDENWTRVERSDVLGAQVTTTFNTTFQDVTFSSSGFIPEPGEGSVLIDGFTMGSNYTREIGVLSLRASPLNKDGQTLPATPLQLTDSRLSTHADFDAPALTGSLTVDTGVIAHFPNATINGNTQLIANQTDPGNPFNGSLLLPLGLGGSSSRSFVLPADFDFYGGGTWGQDSLVIRSEATIQYGIPPTTGDLYDFFPIQDLVFDAPGSSSSGTGFTNNGVIQPVETPDLETTIHFAPGHYDNRNGTIVFAASLSTSPTIDGALIEGGLLTEPDFLNTTSLLLSNGATLKDLDIKGLELIGDSSCVLENINVLDAPDLDSSTIFSGTLTVRGDLTYDAPGASFVFTDVPTFASPSDRLVIKFGTSIEIVSASQALTGFLNEGSINAFTSLTLSTPTTPIGFALDPSTLVATAEGVPGELVTLESLGFTAPLDLISTSTITNPGLLNVDEDLFIREAIVDNTNGTLAAAGNVTISDSIVQNENGIISDGNDFIKLLNAIILGGEIDAFGTISIESSRFNPDTMSNDDFGVAALTTLQNVAFPSGGLMEISGASLAIFGETGSPDLGVSNFGDLLITGSTSIFETSGVYNSNTLTLGGGTLTCSEYFESDGRIIGTGTINTAGVFDNFGIISPGASAGRIHIIADQVILNSSTTFEIELGGPEPATGHDQIFFDTPLDLDLAGTLEVSIIDDFGLCYEDSFEVITTNSPILGNFNGLTSGSRIPVATGGSITIYYGSGSSFDPSSVVLAEYIAKPSNFIDTPYSANLEVIQNAFGNTPADITLNILPGSTAGMFHDDTLSNRGDYALTFPAGVTPLADGVVIPSVSQTTRSQQDQLGILVNDYPTACVFDDLGTYYIGTTRRGSNLNNEFNTNFAVSFFDFDEWLCGYAENNAGNDTNADSLAASPGITLGSEFTQTGFGQFKVDLTGLGGHSDDGILLTSATRNDDNITSVAPNSDGSFDVYVRDNGTADPLSYENDPIAFAYIPFAAVNRSPLIAAGRISGNGDTEAGTTNPDGNANYTINKTGSDTYRLTIPGHTPETGTLLVNSLGGDQVLRDNYVSYTPSGSNWIIKSHTAPGTPVINLNPYGRVFSFAFFSAAKPIEVTTCLDENDAVATDGTGISLREAIRDSLPNSTIYFGPTMAGQTVQITNGQLLIDKNLTLDGSTVARGITLSGTDNSRLFEIAAGSTFSVDSLTLRDGHASGDGGAILVNGHLILTNSTLIHNTCSGNGGAIATVNGGTVFTRNCTLAYNSAPTGNGGAISHNPSPSSELIEFDAAFLTVAYNSANKGGAVHSTNSFIFYDSIAAHNTASSNPTFFEDFIGNDEASVDSDGLVFEAGDNPVNDPRLLPLGDYGGLTPTLHIGPDSPAIGTSGGIVFRTSDQRGFVQGIEDDTIGATLVGGYADLATVWATDYDNDGLSLGLEFVLGTNPSRADFGDPRRAPIVSRNAGGQPTIMVSRSGLLLDTLATQYTILRVQRSTDLLEWREIFRDDENFGTLTQSGYQVQYDNLTRSYTITETAAPPAPRAWYRVEALLIEGEP